MHSSGVSPAAAAAAATLRAAVVRGWRSFVPGRRPAGVPDCPGRNVICCPAAVYIKSAAVFITTGRPGRAPGPDAASGHGWRDGEPHGLAQSVMVMAVGWERRGRT